MEKAKSSKSRPSDASKTSPKASPKTSDASKHKNMHSERLIPTPEPQDRDDIVSTPHVDDDPESYRLT
jgi:hypothetical protein